VIENRTLTRQKTVATLKKSQKLQNVLEKRTPVSQTVFEIGAQGRFLLAHFGPRATISQDVIENRTVKKDLWSFFEHLKPAPT
jgi:hypothetical protein